MPTTTVSVNGKKFDLLCADNNRPHLLKLVEELNLFLDELAKQNSMASLEYLLLIAALNLIDEKYGSDAAINKTVTLAVDKAVQEADKTNQEQLTSMRHVLKLVAAKLDRC